MAGPVPADPLCRNDPVPLDTLPSADRPALTRLSPKKPWIDHLGAALGTVFSALVACATLYAAGGPDRLAAWGWVVALVAGLVLFVELWRFLAARRRAFALRQADIILRSGWFWERTSIVPLARVQHVELHRPFLDRRFGLAELLLYTAGASSVDMKIPGLTEDLALKLEAQILQAIGKPEAASDG